LSPSTADELQRQARVFAGDINELLNNTVAIGASLSAALDPGNGRCWVGLGISRRNIGIPRPVPLAVRPRARPTGYLLVAHVLELDPEGVWLAASKSEYALYLDEEMERMAFHYDYVRQPDNEYPAAHFQVEGGEGPLTELSARLGQSKELKHFHFPVGGRRFRPSLEDVVEFLVVEGLAEAHEGWDRVLSDHREEWHTRQLRAAVRREPASAAEELADLGWQVSAPDAGTTGYARPR
jgi:hypothetical protein